MRRHAVPRHRAPRVVRRGRLGIPDVAGVAGELAALARPHDRVAIADLAARGVHEVCAALHRADQLVVEQALGPGMQRGVDRHDVADAHERLGRLVVGEAQLALDLGRQAVLVGVVQPHVERLQPPQHGRADPPGGDRADLHPLQVVGARDAVGDVPAAVEHPRCDGR